MVLKCLQQLSTPVAMLMIMQKKSYVLRSKLVRIAWKVNKQSVEMMVNDCQNG